MKNLFLNVSIVTVLLLSSVSFAQTLTKKVPVAQAVEPSCANLRSGHIHKVVSSAYDFCVKELKKPEKCDEDTEEDCWKAYMGETVQVKCTRKFGVSPRHRNFVENSNPTYKCGDASATLLDCCLLKIK